MTVVYLQVPHNPTIRVTVSAACSPWEPPGALPEQNARLPLSANPLAVNSC